MNKQTKIEKFNSTYRTGFQVVASIKITQDIEKRTPELNLKLVLHSAERPNNTCNLSFTGVGNLRFSQPGWSLYKVTLLSITDITDRQWEGANYEVNDQEDDSIRFSCRDFDIYTEG